jgi:hypothetical protein
MDDSQRVRRDGGPRPAASSGRAAGPGLPAEPGLAAKAGPDASSAVPPSEAPGRTDDAEGSPTAGVPDGPDAARDDPRPVDGSSDPRLPDAGEDRGPVPH